MLQQAVLKNDLRADGLKQVVLQQRGSKSRVFNPVDFMQMASK
jgi:hypothetical protein